MRTRCWASVCCGVVSCLVAGSAAAATQYTVIELHAPCDYAHPLYADISNQGHAVGEWCVEGWSRGYIVENGISTDLGHLGGGGCFTHGVNSSGQVTGKSHVDFDTVHAYRWEGGVMTDLGMLPGAVVDTSAGLGINEDGVVVGYSYDASGYVRACMWVGTTISDLGTLGGNEAMARGINDQGEVVGNADVAGGDEHAFLHLPIAAYGLPAGMNDLGTFGGESSKALGVNNQGQVIGGLVDLSGYWHAWVWENGSITYLGDLGGDYTSPQDLNNSGQVVGGSSTASGGWDAFLWEDGVMYDLNDYIPSGSGWVLETAGGINDSGWIVGYGTYDGEQRCFLLKPVPEPGTLAIVAVVGALGLLLTRRGRP